MPTFDEIPKLEVREGRTRLLVPDLSKFQEGKGGYAPSLSPVFYNPEMELSRDIAVCIARSFFSERRNLIACDPLCGTGVRGLRYLVEVDGVELAHLNDKNPLAVRFAEENAKLNGVQDRVLVHRRDANSLLYEIKPLDLVDVDPFGTPVPFMDSAINSLLRRGALLAVTATDPAPLCGSKPQACIRKYLARPLKTEYCHELGLRILIGYIVRCGAKYEYALRPIFSHSTRHYFRVYLETDHGAGRADDVLSKIGYARHCSECLYRDTIPMGFEDRLGERCPNCSSRLSWAGPLWIGELARKEIVERALNEMEKGEFNKKSEGSKILRLCLEEIDGPFSYYDTHILARKFGTNPPPILALIEKLRERGFFASRTHFGGRFIRTNAPLRVIEEAYRELSESS